MALSVALAGRLLAGEGITDPPQVIHSHFFPVAVWYSGGKARAPMLETIASDLGGRKMTVGSAEGVADTRAAAARAAGTGEAPLPRQSEGDRSQELKDRAMADNSVQAMLDVFTAEIKDIEEM